MKKLSGSDRLRIMTFNVRYDSHMDTVHAWKNRKSSVVRLIAFFEPDIVGLQEVQKHQLEYLENQLPEYHWIGAGREDGKNRGEFSPLFFKPDRLVLLETGNFWLSENPDRAGSIGWDAKYPRLVTWGKFKDFRNDRIFLVFNTHFDHDSERARRESAHLILKQIKKTAGKHPSIVSGDLNCLPDSEPLKFLLSDRDLVLKDTFHHSRVPHYGPDYTFNAFGATQQHSRIDYLLVEEQWQVWKSAIMPDDWNNNYSSDHYPVLAEINLFQ